MKPLITFLATAALLSTPSLAQRTKPTASKPALSNSSAPAKLLPIFSLMGQTTEAAATPFMLGKKECAPTPTGRSVCNAGFDGQIGNEHMVELIMIFFDGKIGSVSGFTTALSYPDVAAAFKAKYGEPTSVETRKWQSQIGAVFDNEVMTWKFKGGTLELNSMGDSRDEMSFRFVSTDNSPPPPKPVVNF